jgi:hypothetical protein
VLEERRHAQDTDRVQHGRDLGRGVSVAHRRSAYAFSCVTKSRYCAAVISPSTSLVRERHLDHQPSP